MTHDTQRARWVDWVFNPVSVIVFYLMTELVSFLVHGPGLGHRVITYAKYTCLLMLILSSVLWVKRFGWRTGVSPELTAFWLGVMLVVFLIWAILRG